MVYEINEFFLQSYNFSGTYKSYIALLLIQAISNVLICMQINSEILKYRHQPCLFSESVYMILP